MREAKETWNMLFIFVETGVHRVGAVHASGSNAPEKLNAQRLASTADCSAS